MHCFIAGGRIDPVIQREISASRQTKLLIIGGTADHFGGVETFTARAAEALRLHPLEIEPILIPSATAYVSLRTAPKLLRGLSKLLLERLRTRHLLIWLNYVNLADLIYLVLAKALGCRILVTPHLGANWRSQRNPLLKEISHNLLKLADRFALIASTQEKELALPHRHPRSLIRTFLPMEVLEPRSTQKSSNHVLKLLHASRLSEGKGSYDVVDVCKGLRSLGVPFSGQMVGKADDETFAFLRTKISSAEVGEQLKVTGFKPPAELISLMRCSDILIHLSIIDSYPLIVLEALACGMFPIALDLPGARDIIGRFDGHIVSPRHAVEDTVKFLTSADLFDLRRRGAAQAERVRNQFGRDAAAEQLLTALRATAPWLA